jgi:hypothetical protein
VQKNGVFLTRDEQVKLIKKYSINNEVNYARISTELGLHKSSYDYMRSSQKYLKNASIMKSIHSGLNDSKSQYGDIVKQIKTDRNNRQSTNGAIKFILENKKVAILRLIAGLDKKQTGKINKEDFSKILKTMGVFISPNAINNHNMGSDLVDYNSFIQAYTAN